MNSPSFVDIKAVSLDTLEVQQKFLSDFVERGYSLRCLALPREFSPYASVDLVFRCLVNLIRFKRVTQLLRTRLRTFHAKMVLAQKWIRQLLANRDARVHEIWKLWLDQDPPDRFLERVKEVNPAEATVDRVKELMLRSVVWLYWLKRSMFRKSFRAWHYIYTLRAVEKQRILSDAFRSGKPLSSGIRGKLCVLQEEIMHILSSKPKFRFDASSVKTQELRGWFTKYLRSECSPLGPQSMVLNTSEMFRRVSRASSTSNVSGVSSGSGHPACVKSPGLSSTTRSTRSDICTLSLDDHNGFLMSIGGFRSGFSGSSISKSRSFSSVSSLEEQRRPLSPPRSSPKSNPTDKLKLNSDQVETYKPGGRGRNKLPPLPELCGSPSMESSKRSSRRAMDSLSFNSEKLSDRSSESSVNIGSNHQEDQEEDRPLLAFASFHHRSLQSNSSPSRPICQPDRRSKPPVSALDIISSSSLGSLSIEVTPIGRMFVPANLKCFPKGVVSSLPSTAGSSSTVEWKAAKIQPKPNLNLSSKPSPTKLSALLKLPSRALPSPAVAGPSESEQFLCDVGMNARGWYEGDC